MQTHQSPFYLKSTIILLGLTLIGGLVFIGQEIIIPFVFSIFLSIFLNPLYLFFNHRLKIRPILSIILTVTIAFVLVLGFSFFMWMQLVKFSDALPALKVKTSQYLVSLQQWLVKDYGISRQKQLQYLNQGLQNAYSTGGTLVGGMIGALSGFLVTLALVPVYVFLLLLYKRLLISFLLNVFSESTDKVNEILREIKTVIQSYVVGLLIEAGIVAILNSAGLLLLGLDYAILLGVLGAILNLIPYIGGIIAILLPVLIAVITKGGFGYPLAVIGIYMVVQFIDNNILVPRIVAGKVKVNALISILGVLLGGALAGVSGMFLSIPAIAILKIIFDRVDELKPWGLLLGEDEPKSLPEQLEEEKNGPPEDIVENS